MSYLDDRMMEIVDNLRNSRSKQYPPIYSYDDSIFRNCYAHALDIRVEYKQNRELFRPGYISDLANKRSKGVLIINNPCLCCYEVYQILQSAICDCRVLGDIAIETKISKPHKFKESYKIVLCEETELGLWHWVRESVLEDGKRVWTHKEGFKMPSGILTQYGNMFIGEDDSKYNILAALELTPNRFQVISNET